MTTALAVMLAWCAGVAASAVALPRQPLAGLAVPRDEPAFDRRAYLAQSGAYLEMRSATLQVTAQKAGVRGFPGWLRDRYQQSISGLMPSPHAQVLVAVVLGVRTGIPTALQQ